MCHGAGSGRCAWPSSDADRFVDTETGAACRGLMAARECVVRARTGTLEDMLVVARADADLWRQSTTVKRGKLVAPEQQDRVSG